MGAQHHENFHAQTQEAFETVFSFVTTLVLKSALLLEIPDIIAREGPNASLSVTEIAAHLPTKNGHLDYLTRILRYLSSRGIFLRSRVGDVDRYALSSSAKLFFVEEKNHLSLVPLALLETRDVMMARWAWHHLHECVLQGCHPFLKAHGRDIYSCGKDDPQFNNVINDCMGFFTITGIDQIVNCYEGFKELQSIVDVGVGEGERNGTGANRESEEYEMGNSDLVKQKVLFDWDDESCMKILGKCYKTFPESGRLILVEEAATDEMN
ncbi:hypothetical protein KI387_005278 [Taxus chinensis]|uniref:Uncharacterized protein n=1 Tax=Taxus chinensis TaxID=29808 RepID=A0AA38LJQ3_TAXCH|nr:hypothetical protein KI387_005278 [Taxus chinensis]